MRAGKDLNGLPTHDEVEGIGEVRQDGSPDIAMHDPELLRRSSDR